MALSTVWQMALLSVLAAQPAPPAPAPAAAPRLPAAVATRQYMFAVPFRVSPPAQPARQPVEVQLFVSGDRGTTWQLYSRTAPTQRQFLFRAAGDGEFWFAVRTLDRGGQLRPQRIAAPELRVIVDTAPPQLQLNAQATPDGRITAQWRVEDRTLRPDALAIQWRAAPKGDWQKIALDRNLLAAAGPVQSGETTWQLPGVFTQIEVRAETADAAGNPAVTHALVKNDAAEAPAAPATTPPTGPPPSPWPPEAQPQPNPPADATANAPASVSSEASAGWRAGGAEAAPTTWPATPYPTAGQRPLADAPRAPALPAPPIVTPPAAVTAPAVSAAEMTPSPPTPLAPPTPAAVGPQLTPPAVAPAPTSEPATAPDAAADAPAVEAANLKPEAAAEAPATNPAPAAAAPAPAAAPPPPDRTVRARRFELEYDVPPAAAPQLQRVELWATSDGGRTWQLHCLDDDRASPVVVTVDHEGLWGFRIVMQGLAGAAGQPKPGDRPELVIGVEAAPAAPPAEEPVPSLQIVDPRSGERTSRVPPKRYVWQ